MSPFVTALKIAMQEQDITQLVLAERIGVRQSAVSKILRGVVKNPPRETVEKMEAALRLKRHELWNLLHGVSEPMHAGSGVPSLRLFGTVPAGFPVAPQEGYGDEWNFEEHLGGRGRFLLRVKGISMSGDGIHEGDLVVVQPDRKAESGQIVVAKVNGQDTVKRLVRKGKAWELVSSHQDYPPMPLTRNDQAGIVGVVVGLVRLY